MTNDMRVRRDGSAASNCTLTLAAQTSDRGDLLTDGIVNELDPLEPPPILIAEVALVPRRETRTGAAFPALPRGLNLSLTGESKNDGAWQRLLVLVHLENPSAGSAEDIGLRRATSSHSTEHTRG